jgi:exodeoxyribonuclease-3
MLRWFEHFAQHAAELLAEGVPAVLAGDYNVMPTELDVYKPERWIKDALFRPKFAMRTTNCWGRAG